MCVCVCVRACVLSIAWLGSKFMFMLMHSTLNCVNMSPEVCDVLSFGHFAL
jgi:hypothetical protein